MDGRKRNCRRKRKRRSHKRLRWIGACAAAFVILAGSARVWAFTETVRVMHVPEATATVERSLAQTSIVQADSVPSGMQEADNGGAAQEDWRLLLVNPWNTLPEGFSVQLTTLKNGHAIDERAYPELQAMMDAARAEGLSPIICSSYRTQEKQQALFDAQVNKNLAQGYSREEAERKAGEWVAVPGTSEHQSGLAIDIVSLDYQILDENQEKTPEQKWLMENCWKYGFILRYPTDKSELTGIGYEPWHYRYVGKEAAKEITEKGLCLEEYLADK